jgi:hypothetical protein
VEHQQVSTGIGPPYATPFRYFLLSIVAFFVIFGEQNPPSSFFQSSCLPLPT